MGNKQSSGGGSSDGVKKRSKKTGKNKSGDRPVSMPGFMDDQPAASDQGGMRRAGSVDMGSIQPAEVSFYPNKIVAGSSDLAGETVFNLYKRGLHQVITTWPDLAQLREIDPKKISSQLLQALQRLYDTVCKSEKDVESLRKEKKNLNDAVTDLEARFNNQVDETRKKDDLVSDLDHKVCLLEGELRKRGIAPRVQNHNEPPGDYDYLEPEISRNNKNRGSAMMPTPFLQAGGQRGQDAAIKRSNSMLTDGRRATGRLGAPENSVLLEDLNKKVRSLQLELETKRRENADLRDRLEGGFDTGSSLKQLAPHSGPNIESLVDLYGDLEDRALNKVTDRLYDILTDKGTGLLHQFLCFTMETSFLRASSLMKIFLDTVHSLLINPLKAELPRFADADNKSARSQGHINKTMFEKGPDIHAMSRLARRTRLTAELPKYLEEEVASFIRVTSDSTNIDILIEEVQDVLRRKFPSYATEAVFSDSTFADFLSESCRLSWQLCSMSPPCNVTIDDTRMRYDEYYHDVLPSQKTPKITIGAEIDYFIWPMLLRNKNSEVLYKSRVALISKPGQRF